MKENNKVLQVINMEKITADKKRAFRVSCYFVY